MKKRIVKGIAAAFSFIMILTVAVSNVYAADVEIETDSSGNTYVAGQSVSFAKDVGNELFMAGQDVNGDNIDVAGSAFIAGMNVNFNNSSTGASAFIAGMNVSIDTDAENNIWVVGQRVNVGDNTEVRAIHAAGENVTVGGTYEYAVVYGNNIVFNGTVNGDAEFEGANVTFGKDAVITGTVKVKSGEEPTVKDGAEVGNIDFELTVKENDEEKDATENVKDTVEKVTKKTLGVIILSKIRKFIYWALAYAIIAIVLSTVFNKNLEESYAMSVKEKPLAFWLSGVIGLIVIPIALIILCITFIGAPAAGMVGVIYSLALAVSRIFTFSSLIRELIFTRVSKRMNPILETVLAAVLASFVKLIPVVSGVVGLICKVYTIGYIIQVSYKKMNNKKSVETADGVQSQPIEG